MSAKKRKESVEIKQDNDEPKIDKEFENLHEEIESDIAVDSPEQHEPEAEPTEEDLLEKERTKAKNMARCRSRNSRAVRSLSTPT